MLGTVIYKLLPSLTGAVCDFGAFNITGPVVVLAWLGVFTLFWMWQMAGPKVGKFRRFANRSAGVEAMICCALNADSRRWLHGASNAYPARKRYRYTSTVSCDNLFFEALA